MEISADFFFGRNAGYRMKRIIKNAEFSIKIISPYLSDIEIEELQKTIIAEKRILDVSIITCASEQSLRILSHRKALEKLIYLKAKNRLPVFKTVFVNDSSVHAKLYIVDDKLAYAGSLNFTTRGMGDNFEICFTIEAGKNPDKLKELSIYYDNFFNSILYPKCDANELSRRLRAYIETDEPKPKKSLLSKFIFWRNKK